MEIMAITTTAWEYDDGGDGEMSALMLDARFSRRPPRDKKHVSTGPKGRKTPHQLRRRLAWVVVEIKLRKREGES